MTYKYLYIRQEMYEKDPMKKIYSTRSLKKMKQLFKIPCWIMLGVLFISSISLAIFFIFFRYSPFVFIPVSLVILVSILFQIPRDKYLYNDKLRETELSEIKNKYNEYALDVRNIFINNGIDTSEKLLKLKTECELTLKERENKYKLVSNKAFEVLIYVPLGAYIASIYTHNNVAPLTIEYLLLSGFIILGALRGIRWIQYYSDGSFKDKYLLSTINELDYYENLFI